MTGWQAILTPEVLGLSGAGFAVVALGMGPLIQYLAGQGRMAQPNARSNHTTPKPEGGGLLVLATLIPIWFLLADRPMGHILLPAAVLGVSACARAVAPSSPR